MDEDEEEERAPVSPGPARPARWGPLPALVLGPTLVIMFVIALMGYEMIHGMWGYRQSEKASGLLVRPLAGAFTDDLPKE